MGEPVRLAFGHHEKTNGMNGRERSGREYGPLHALLSATGDEGAEVCEITEGFFVHG
jgi:hypothetical protein